MHSFSPKWIRVQNDVSPKRSHRLQVLHKRLGASVINTKLHFNSRDYVFIRELSLIWRHFVREHPYFALNEVAKNMNRFFDRIYRRALLTQDFPV